MQTTESIDQEVKVLHEELDRSEGKKHFHCNKRCTYILGIAGLLLVMFLFGLLTHPRQKAVVTTEVEAVLDVGAPRLVEPALSKHLSALHKALSAPSPLVPTQVSTATEPHILTWTPDALGKTNPDGSIVPVTGSYTLPAGYEGIIRITADGVDIGSVIVDARANTTQTTGRFAITPLPLQGEQTVRITLDAVKACRITCDPRDALCLATNVNSCTALYDNQAFLAYTPKVAEALPPAGSCVTKTFVAGPRYAPQIPEDYTMCEKGNWNTDIVVDAYKWGALQSGLKDKDIAPFVSALGTTFNLPSSRFIGAKVSESVIEKQGSSANLSWTLRRMQGSANDKKPCAAIATVSVNCQQVNTK